MSTTRSRTLLFITLSLWLSAKALASASVSQDDKAVRQWVRDVTPSVEKLLTDTLHVAPAEGFATEFEWQVVVTAHDGWWLTWKALLQKPWHGEVRGRYFVLRHHNLERQLFLLRESNPAMSDTAAMGRLRIASGAAGSASCAALRILADQLEHIEIPALPDNSLRMHAPGYGVAATTAYRWGREYALYSDEGPLAEWCERLLAVLKECH
jgi:hypothetical protein